AEIVIAGNDDSDVRRSGAVSAFWVFSVMERNISGIIRNCTAPVRIVKYRAARATMPVPIQVQSHSSAPPSQELKFSRSSMTKAYQHVSRLTPPGSFTGTVTGWTNTS